MTIAYSFDVWLTLIKSNPEFKLRRNSMFFKNFNPCDYNLEKVSEIIRKIDIEGNKMSEITGIHVSSYILIYQILKELGNQNINKQILDLIHVRIQSLFLEYQPSLYDKNTAKVLKKLFEDRYYLTILSNTGFITGHTLDIVLHNLGIRQYFQNAFYSDEICVSKPNCNAFFEVQFNYRNQPNKIIHVGDNPIADGGCINVPGFEYFQINSNDKTILDLIK